MGGGGGGTGIIIIILLLSRNAIDLTEHAPGAAANGHVCLNYSCYFISSDFTHVTSTHGPVREKHGDHRVITWVVT